MERADLLDRVAEKPGYYCLRCGVELNTPKERRYGLCERHFKMAVGEGRR